MSTVKRTTSSGEVESTVRECGSRVAVKADHDSDGQIRWASSPVTGGLDSSHCSIDEADFNPESPPTS